MTGNASKLVAASLVAGTLDLLYAVTAHGLNGLPARVVLQAIASGLLGRDAYSGGIEIAALGVGLHYVLIFAFATAYAIAARHWPLLWRQPWSLGALYGLMLFFAMNYLLVPISAAYPGTPPTGYLFVGGLAAHVLLVGVPIAYLTRPRLAAGM